MRSHHQTKIDLIERTGMFSLFQHIRNGTNCLLAQYPHSTQNARSRDSECYRLVSTVRATTAFRGHNPFAGKLQGQVGFRAEGRHDLEPEWKRI